MQRERGAALRLRRQRAEKRDRDPRRQQPVTPDVAFIRIDDREEQSRRARYTEYERRAPVAPAGEAAFLSAF